MVTKLYVISWLFLFAAAGVVDLTNKSSEATQTVFSSAFVVLAVIGIAAILPWWVDRRYTWKE